MTVPPQTARPQRCGISTDARHAFCTPPLSTRGQQCRHRYYTPVHTGADTGEHRNYAPVHTGAHTHYPHVDNGVMPGWTTGAEPTKRAQLSGSGRLAAGLARDSM